VDDDSKRKLIVTAAAIGGVATGMVFFGLVGAPVIGGAAGLLAYRMLGSGEEQAKNTLSPD
jgi:hypothetical protein